MDFLDALTDIDAADKALGVEALATEIRQNQSDSRRALCLTFKREALLPTIGAGIIGLIDDISWSFDESMEVLEIGERNRFRHSRKGWFSARRQNMLDIVDRYLQHRIYQFPKDKKLGSRAEENSLYCRQLLESGLLCVGASNPAAGPVVTF